MANEYNDAVAFPAYATKQAILRALMQNCPNCPNLQAILFSINRTDLNALADKSTYFHPDGSFDAAE